MPEDRHNSIQPTPTNTGFGNVPKPAAGYRNVPQAAAGFGTVPQGAERKQNHTLTVREVARLFEAAGVARTERSIVNWCQRDALGTARLDSYFDRNERKCFITPRKRGAGDPGGTGESRPT